MKKKISTFSDFSGVFIFCARCVEFFFFFWKSAAEYSSLKITSKERGENFSTPLNFLSDFVSHFVKENRSITVYRPMTDKGGNITKFILWSQETIRTSFSHVSIFIFFSRKLNSFTLLGTEQNRSNSVKRHSLAAD